jgi:hypothetical protein
VCAFVMLVKKVAGRGFKKVKYFCCERKLHIIRTPVMGLPFVQVQI